MNTLCISDKLTRGLLNNLRKIIFVGLGLLILTTILYGSSPLTPSEEERTVSASHRGHRFVYNLPATQQIDKFGFLVVFGWCITLTAGIPLLLLTYHKDWPRRW